ncbi:MAG: hypothetical protein Q9185_004050 [Variospora sp. 1 TL-2023]
MHHHQFFFFSLFFIFALPSFAQRAITLGISPTTSGPQHLFVVPYDSLAKRDPLVKPSDPEFFYIPNTINSPSADRVSYISIIGVEDVEGTLETKNITCQCFSDKDGKQILGDFFTAEVEPWGQGHLIPDTDPIESIFCSNMQGLWDQFVKHIIQPSSSSSVETQAPIPDMAFEASTSTVSAAPTPRPRM